MDLKYQIIATLCHLTDKLNEKADREVIADPLLDVSFSVSIDHHSDTGNFIVVLTCLHSSCGSESSQISNDSVSVTLRPDEIGPVEYVSEKRRETIPSLPYDMKESEKMVLNIQTFFSDILP